MKAKPYEVDLAEHFQDVDSLLAIAFQIAIRNRRKQSKVTGEVLPASKRRGKAKQSSLHQGDGAQGASTAELVEKKQGAARREEEEEEGRNGAHLALVLSLVLTPTIDP